MAEPSLDPLIENLLAQVAGCKAAQFASFVYIAKGSGEVARHTLILNATTEELYRKDVDILTPMLAAAGSELERLVIAELLDSRNASLTLGIGNNPAYTCKDAYIQTEIRNIKIHKDTGNLHISGLKMHKEVIMPGEHKVVKSSEKTLAKNKIRALLPSEKFRQFDLAHIAIVRMNGQTLEVVTE